MRRRYSLLPVLLLLLTGGLAAEEARITLGPWLHYTSPQEAEVCWRSNIPVATQLEYDFSDSRPWVLSEGESTEHRVRLLGLPRHRTVDYRIGLPGADSELIWHRYEVDTSFNYTLPRLAAEEMRWEKGAYHLPPWSIEEQQGYCIILGCADGRIAFNIAQHTRMQVIGLDTDASLISAARKKLHDLGARISLRQVDSYESLPFTGNFANRVVVAQAEATDGLIREALRILQPGLRGALIYTGDPLLPEGMKPVQDTMQGWKRLSLPADNRGGWTHQYGSPDNAAKSQESLGGVAQTSDLAVQWLGRPGPRAMVDRNPRMPSPLFCNGSLYTQGFQRLIAQDAYNGAIRWTLELPGWMRYNLPRDCSNWCADEAGVVIAHQGHAWRIDAKDGAVAFTYPVVTDNSNRGYDWGYIAQMEDALFGSAVARETAYTGWLGKEFWYDKPTGKPTEKVCSDVIFAMNRNSGETLWQRNDHLVMNPTITIADGTMFFVEIRDKKLKAGNERRIAAKKYKGKQYLVALDAETGELRWEQKLKANPGSVVCYLLHAEGTLIYATSDKKYGLVAFDASSGDKRWEQEHDWTGGDHSGHMQHPVILAGTVYLEPRGYNLQTGALVTETVGRHGGCATYMAVENALIYRGPDRQTSMWDIANNKVTNWTRLRPGCWLSTIAGAGMVLAPEAGGGCSCGGWMETSVAFAPVAR